MMTEYFWAVKILWADNTTTITHLCETKEQARTIADEENDKFSDGHMPFSVSPVEEK